MNKADLITLISYKQRDVTKSTVAYCVDAILDKIKDELVIGTRVEVRGFGAFTLRTRKPRLVHNPKTLEKFVNPQRGGIHFRPGKKLFELINIES